MSVTIQIVCLLVFASLVESNLTKKRLQVLERKFSTNVYEMSLLLQRTETIEDRLSMLENASNPTSVTPRIIIPEDPRVPKLPVEDNINKLMLNAFEAEKVQRKMLEDRCEKLEEKLIQLQESSRLERDRMNERIDLLTSFQDNLKKSLILKQVEENRHAIADIGDEFNAKLGILSNNMNQKANKNQEQLLKEITGVQERISSNSEILNKKLEQYKSGSLTQADVTQLLNQKKVSFSARLRSSVSDLRPWKTLIFDYIIKNDGNAYSGSTGIFTAPLKGTYVFFVHILGTNRSLEMVLYKNNKGVMWLYVNGPGHGADSNMVVLQLNKGDRVNVVKHGPYGSPPFYVHTTWSTFSGFMLYSN